MPQWIVVSVGAALLLHSGSGAGACATGQYRIWLPPEQGNARAPATKRGGRRPQERNGSE